MGRFAEQCAAFAEKARRRIVYTRNAAAMALAEEITANLSVGAPNVVTGFLRASLMASTAPIPLWGKDAPAKGGSYTPDLAALQARIMAAKIDQVVWLGFGAAYARRLEYGFVGTDSLGQSFNQSGFGFVARAVAKLPGMIAEAAADSRRAIP